MKKPSLLITEGGCDASPSNQALPRIANLAASTHFPSWQSSNSQLKETGTCLGMTAPRYTLTKAPLVFLQYSSHHCLPYCICHLFSQTLSHFPLAMPSVEVPLQKVSWAVQVRRIRRRVPG